ncbi:MULTISPECIES: hypothetical protein [unclassified Leifsonia]|uniref:hypothetical protein n=1 Tax=unclassified Leifsonia TaxID=2663824 RepID=UPI0006F9E836|nr:MULTISPECIES: hypothetical protein [unclassified Leifsonia]KQX07192.1 hypothetical protein ASC59_05190 [Leifsonia sp. Root1293]KRA11475.1 hypothetical protein ASD61_05190 [Leifsonia sp. Root60]
MYTVLCEHCGAPFAARSPRALTCGQRCRQARSRTSRAELHAFAVELILDEADAYELDDYKSPGYVDRLLGS